MRVESFEGDVKMKFLVDGHRLLCFLQAWELCQTPGSTTRSSGEKATWRVGGLTKRLLYRVMSTITPIRIRFSVLALLIT